MTDQANEEPYFSDDSEGGYSSPIEQRIKQLQETEPGTYGVYGSRRGETGYVIGGRTEAGFRAAVERKAAKQREIKEERERVASEIGKCFSLFLRLTMEAEKDRVLMRTYLKCEMAAKYPEVTVPENPKLEEEILSREQELQKIFLQIATK